MNPGEAFARLEAILRAENEALARHDAPAATSMLQEKLAAAEALSASGLSLEDGECLRTLAAENRRLLEQAIKVQGRIVAMVARAAQASSPGVARYGAQGRALTSGGALALARQA